MTYQLHNQSEHGVQIQMTTKNGLERWMQVTAKGTLAAAKSKNCLFINPIKPTKEMRLVASEVYAKLYK
ncbi:hypothetical protein NVP1132O_43 [Vibrio phage 1.132.O._10N.222.49.F8]|nr:hypothetical protein NVP1132O_43 [Vibrio phage 1.132.O._10N.222.49.F8]